MIFFDIPVIISQGIIIFLFLTNLLLILYIFIKLKTINFLKKRVRDLEDILSDLDRQAKFIIKNDIELKLYQEEINDKLNKLELLRNLIISSLNIFERDDLLMQINEKIINSLGFKRALIFTYEDNLIKLNINFSQEEVEYIKNFFLAKKDLLSLSNLFTHESEICGNLKNYLKTSFLISIIKGRELLYAGIILSDFILGESIRKEEKEVFSIICAYFGQVIDNIKSFENMYLMKEELERKNKEKTYELLKTLKELEEVNKRKTDFISSVSHEMRTPLTSIKGYSELLVEEKFGKLPEEAKNRLTKIDEHVNKLVEMVNTLLDISRIESGKWELKIIVYDLVKLIKEICDFLLPQFRGKNINLEINLPTELNVYIDKELIERVFINLLNNAIKFTPHHGKIIITTQDQNNYVIVSIKDTGCGINKDNLHKLFQEFFRENNPINTQVKGTGLGLSLVKRIIDAHREKIWVESEIEKGTTFYFTLRKA